MFGDSYSTPNVCVEPQDSFWGLTASTLGINKIINCSRSSNSFNSVQHLLISMSQQISWQNDLIFVGIPPLERITVFDDYKDTAYLGYEITTDNWCINNFDIPCHRGLVSLQNYGHDRELILHSDRSWLETEILRQIFLLTQWLDNVDAKYLIINLSKDLDENNQWGPSNFVLPYCKEHKKCILFKDTYHSVNIGINKPVDFDGPEGHHGPVGNKYFFEKSLLPKLKELNLC